jgi:putative addiction module CopG family antidote
MQISLTKPELEKFIADQVQSGSFKSPDEVIEEALSRMMLEDGLDALDEETQAAIARAEAEFDRGEDRPFSEFAAELLARVQKK